MNKVFYLYGAIACSDQLEYPWEPRSLSCKISWSVKVRKIHRRFQFALKYSLRPTSGYWKQQLPHLALVNGQRGTDMTLNLNVITLTCQLNLQSNLHLLNCHSLLCHSTGPFCSLICSLHLYPSALILAL